MGRSLLSSNPVDGTSGVASGRDVSKWALASHQRSARSWGVGVKDFRRLEVWHKAHQLVLVVYRETSNFSADERFGLTSQLRRAAVSIPANNEQLHQKTTEVNADRRPQTADRRPQTADRSRTHF